MIDSNRRKSSTPVGFRGNGKEPIRLLLVDDVTVLRQGIRALLDGSGRVEVVGETADGLMGVALARRLRPSLVLAEIALPSLDGFEVTRRIREVHSGARVLIYTHLDGSNLPRASRAAGASGFLTKRATFEELLAAMEMIAQGETFFGSPSPPARATADGEVVAPDPAADRLALLTRREREVLGWICEGESNRRIAKRLRISIKTVDTHRTHLMKKLDLHHVTGLTKFALRNGLDRHSPGRVDPLHRVDTLSPK